MNRVYILSILSFCFHFLSFLHLFFVSSVPPW